MVALSLDLDEALLSTGKYWCTVPSAADALGRSEVATRSVIQRLLQHRRLFSPARGFYVVVPAEYRAWGVVPASWFVDPMMAHLGRSYYVALLSAAEAHGAAHQRPQVFQVMVNRGLASRDFERVRMRMYAKATLSVDRVTRVNTHTGTMAVSSPELSVVNLAGHLRDAGGLDNLATVIVELAEDGRLSANAFAAVAGEELPAPVRRAGWLIEHLTDLTLDDAVTALRQSEPVRLDPYGARRGHVDERWGVRVNADVEPEA